MSLSQIFEGWKNHLSPDSFLQEKIFTLSNERLAICKDCPFNSIVAGPINSLRFDYHCTRCGCTLIPKTKCLSCGCPEHKWEAEVTPEEEQKIEKNERL